MVSLEFKRADLKRSNLSIPLRSNDLKACARCNGSTFYCSDSCKELDWQEGHKFECSLFATKPLIMACSQHMDIDFYRFLLRYFLIRTCQPIVEDIEFELVNNRIRKLDDLMGHEVDIRSDTTKMSALVGITKHLHTNSYPADFDQLVKFYGQLAINNFSIEGHGLGLYIEASIFDHSCRPNACQAWFGTKLQIRAVKEIEPHEQILINYTSLLKAKHIRRAELLEKFYFACNCTKCADPNDEQINYGNISTLIKTHFLLHKRKRYEESYHLLKVTIPLVQEAIGEYAPYVTILLTKLLITRLMLARMDRTYPLDESDTNKIKKRLYLAAQVTHGKEHPMYKYYYELIRDIIGRR